jgi:hypothetical protein
MKFSLASWAAAPRFGRIALSGGVLAGGVLTWAGLTLPAPRAMAGSGQQQTPMEVTTDTPEYCHQLADRVHMLVQFASAKPPREVADLSVEGEKMCDHGQTRGGIMRLREAILMMKHDGPSSSGH